VQPNKTTCAPTLRRVAITAVAVFLLGFGLSTAPAVAAPAVAAPAVAAPAVAAPATARASAVVATAPQSTLGQRSPAAASFSAGSTAVTAVTAPALTPGDPFWVTVWQLLQQFWAWLFPPAQQLPIAYSGSANQVLTVVAAPGSSDATLQAWRRVSGGWASVLGPVPAKVGPTGIGQASEYSANTPAGTYSLTQAFGRQANPGTALPYFQTGGLDWWDENPSSPTYNLHVVQPQSPGGNSENLYGAGPVYDEAVVIDYNTARVPGAGSGFFLHVTNGSPTAGCVAIAQPDLVAIMQFLNPGQHPDIDIATH